MMYSGPNRTVCDVLEEIRKCDETKNYSYLLGLVEQIQSLVNNMESALWDQKKFTRAEKQYRKLKKRIKKMEEELESEAE